MGIENTAWNFENGLRERDFEAILRLKSGPREGKMGRNLGNSEQLIWALAGIDITRRWSGFEGDGRLKYRVRTQVLATIMVSSNLIYIRFGA
jgi:hypothetical protein